MTTEMEVDPDTPPESLVYHEAMHIVMYFGMDMKLSANTLLRAADQIYRAYKTLPMDIFKPINMAIATLFTAMKMAKGEIRLEVYSANVIHKLGLKALRGAEGEKVVEACVLAHESIILLATQFKCLYARTALIVLIQAVKEYNKKLPVDLFAMCQRCLFLAMFLPAVMKDLSKHTIAGLAMYLQFKIEKVDLQVFDPEWFSKFHKTDNPNFNELYEQVCQSWNIFRKIHVVDNFNRLHAIEDKETFYGIKEVIQYDGNSSFLLAQDSKNFDEPIPIAGDDSDDDTVEQPRSTLSGNKENRQQQEQPGPPQGVPQVAPAPGGEQTQASGQNVILNHVNMLITRVAAKVETYNQENGVPANPTTEELILEDEIDNGDLVLRGIGQEIPA